MYTEEQVKQLWLTNDLPAIKEQFEQDGIPDIPARRESWGQHIDALQRSNLITPQMANSIDIDEEKY